MSRRLSILLIASGCLLQAQEYRSTITGRITDPSGAAVANVKIVATKNDTNTLATTVSGPEGFYTIPQLLPGTYELTAEAAGFKKQKRPGIELASNTRVGVDLQLTLGNVTESVTVTDSTPLLNTVSASAGQSIDTREVQNLPINGRAPMDLVVLGYGVVNTGVRDQNRPYENGGFSDFAMGGGVSGANEVLLDGVPNIGTLGTTGRRAAFSPSADSVSEVKVEVFNVDAAYGGAGGGTVEVVTKGGTNRIHGSASEFNQVSRLAATPFFTNQAGSTKTVSRQNTWGVTAGGPLYIPKVFNGRDKLFWFFSYEGHKNSEPAPTFTTVPTAEERNGDFSALLRVPVTGASYTIYDPASARLSGGSVVRTAFQNNVIPQARLTSPLAKNYLSYVGMPNNTFNVKPDGTNNYFVGLTTNNAYTSYSGRMDANIGNKNKLSGSVHESLWQQTSGDLFSNIALGEHAFRALWGANLDDVHTFTPTLVGNLRAGYNRYRAYYAQNSDGFDPTKLGFPSYIAANATKLLMPQFSFSDGFLTANPVTNLHMVDQPYNTYQLFGSLTKILGTHTVKFGAEHRVMDFSNISWSGSTGNYTFDSTWVKANNGAAAGQPLGGSIAAFLLDLPSSGSYAVNTASKNDSLYEVAFLQDDWHLRSNLTVNAGLRYEYNSPTRERWDRQVIGFAAAAANSASAAAQTAYGKAPLAQLPASQFSATGGLNFASSSNRDPSSTSKKSFSPRLGISWTPTALHNKTVIRSGVGFFDYVYGPILPQQPGFSSTTTYVATNDSFLTPATTLSNPFPTGILRPVGAAQGVNTNLGQSVTFLNPNLARQYSLRWTVDVQHQIAKDLVLQVGYVGNHSVHLTTSYNFGSLPAQYLSRSAVRDNDNITALSKTVANPFAGLLPGTTLNGATAASNLLKPFPEFTGVTESNMNNGGSYFHELAIGLNKRMSHGFLVALNYSHSRLMESISYLNAGSLALEKRVSAGDRPNNVTLSMLYQLPFGRGKRFASGANGFLNTVIGNWNVSSLYNFHSGAPAAWGNLLYLGGDLQYNPRNVNRAFDTTRFNTVSAQQLSQNFRTFPTQFNNLRVDGTNNWNVAVSKEFSLWEKAKLHFRADAYNLANHALFAAPNLTATSGAFGSISSQTNTPRLIQGSLRLTF